jgi:F-type H+-transporting ATPase subunit epsilon
MSVNVFRLQIVSSNRIFYEGKVKILIIPTFDGEFAIMAHHESTTIAVETGVVRYQKEDDTWETGVISKGFVAFANNRASMYVYSCEKPEEIDVVRAQEALERAEEQLRQKLSMIEYKASQASLARAIARLKAANQNKPIGF